MPPRSPPPRGSFTPPNDNATYSDLLRFEERLKTTAASLQRRKARYQLFLFQLLLVIAFLLSEVLLPPQSSLLAIPYRLILQRLLPKVYTPDVQVTVHPYFSSGLLFVSVTTLVLFFASGMYSEKIAYANKYVPHANRALRSFNMYLNVRKPPLQSKFYFNPLSFFFPRPEHQQHSQPPSKNPSRSPSPSSSNPRSRSSSISLPILSIPPSTNPRGELIFSSRVDQSFQESYGRYRATFERKREEKERTEKAEWWRRKVMFWRKIPMIPAPSGSPTVAGIPTMRTVSSSSSSSRSKAGGSRSGTPPRVGGTVIRHRERSGSPMRRGTPSGRTPSPSASRDRMRNDEDMKTT